MNEEFDEFEENEEFDEIEEFESFQVKNLELIREQDLELLKTLQKSEANSIKKYKMSESFKEFDVIEHPTFGLGFVKECLDRKKIQVVFEDRNRILMMNH